MEGSATQCFPQHVVVLPSDDGGARWHAFLSGNILLPAFLLSLGRRDTALLLVAAADVADETHIQHPRQMDGADIDSRCHPIGGQHGLGLLGLRHQTPWFLLRRHHRRDSSHRLAMGISLPAKEHVGAHGLHHRGDTRGLSADGCLCPGSRSPHGSDGVASSPFAWFPHPAECHSPAGHHHHPAALLSLRLQPDQPCRYLSYSHSCLHRFRPLSPILLSILCAGRLLPDYGHHLPPRAQRAQGAKCP